MGTHLLMQAGEPSKGYKNDQKEENHECLNIYYTVYYSNIIKFRFHISIFLPRRKGANAVKKQN